MARCGRRILIDGTSAKSGGGFTYLVNIVPRLAAIAPSDQLRLLVSSEPIACSIPSSANLEIDLVAPVSWPGRLLHKLVEVPRVIRSWGADLYYAAGELVPLRAPCTAIASFRNMNLYTEMDQGWELPQRLRMRVLRAISRHAVKTCERIVFVSEDSARWIGDSLGVPPERRAVVHHGIDAEAWRRLARASPLPFSYILSVSSVYRYKNYVRLIEAYTMLARRRRDVPDLVIIGDDQDPAYSARMRQARDAAGEFAEHIHLLGEVPYVDIKDYYAGADLFVFPSYLEAFGHPLLEAMATGLPTVAADIPVFREIAGDAVLYANPHQTESLASAIEDALFTPGARETLRERARARALAFSWDRTARTLYALFEEVLDERSGV